MPTTGLRWHRLLGWPASGSGRLHHGTGSTPGRPLPKSVHVAYPLDYPSRKLLREDNPEYFAVAWDPPGPTFREEKFAAYKETRAPTPDDLRTQIPLVKTLFEALRLPLLEVPGFEADDVLGTVVDRTRDLPIDLYENLSLVPGKLRETLAANRKQALLSRELATVSTRVPIAVDLDAFRRREPDWERLRALWTELEFHSLLRQLPAEPAPEATGGEVPTLADAAALAGYLAKVPAGEPLAVDAVTAGGRRSPSSRPSVCIVCGEAILECGGPEMAPALPQSADNLQILGDYARVDYIRDHRLPHSGLAGVGANLSVALTKRITLVAGYGYGIHARRGHDFGGHDIDAQFELKY